MIRLFLSCIVSLPILFYAQERPFDLVEKWSLGGLETPESVHYDAPTNAIYVSNINGSPGVKDGNGYISKISVGGEFLSKKWVSGLNAPAGFAFYEGKMYVADIDYIVEIDIAKGKIIKKHKAPNATFLNDVAIAPNGDVYVSNTFGEAANTIYKLSNGKVETWLKDQLLNLPNGLLVKDDILYVASWGTNPNPETFQTENPGKLIKINLETKTIETVIENVGNLDGITETIHGILMSDWVAGKLLYTADYKTIVEVKSLEPGCADIEFEKTSKTVYVPQLQDGYLNAYSVKPLH